eukprot:6869912-Prymnesium_polylepis.1
MLDLHHAATTRRAVVAGAALSAGVSCHPVAAAPVEAFKRVEGYTARVEGIGGSADLLSGSPSIPDVTYPPSVLGLWQCQRVVVSVEGDRAQAQGAWYDLGGGGGDVSFAQPETFYARFLPSPSPATGSSGPTAGVVLDRGFEIDSRVRGASRVGWDAAAPNSLVYERRAGGVPTEIVVVERSVEPPSDK